MLLSNTVALALGGLETSSQISYGVGQRRLLRYAKDHGLRLSQLLPIRRSVLLGFAAWLFSDPKKLQHKTIKSYLCHVRHLSDTLGLDNSAFSCPRLRKLMYAIRKARRSRRRATRLPITIALLVKFAMLLHDDNHTATLVLAALTTGVYGLMRSGELAIKTRHDQMEPENLLTRSSVTWEERKFTIHLAVSKTDPFREGTDITIYANGSSTCPYAALRRLWENVPLTFPLAPLFQHENGKPLRYHELNAAIKNLAAATGLDPSSFSGHSMRIGGATSLAMRGYSQNVIQALGRWKSLSVQLYTRLTGGMREQVANALAKPLEIEKHNLFGGVEPTLACKLSVEGFCKALANPTAWAT